MSIAVGAKANAVYSLARVLDGLVPSMAMDTVEELSIYDIIAM